MLGRLRPCLWGDRLLFRHGTYLAATDDLGWEKAASRNAISVYEVGRCHHSFQGHGQWLRQVGQVAARVSDCPGVHIREGRHKWWCRQVRTTKPPFPLRSKHCKLHLKLRLSTAQDRYFEGFDGTPSLLLLPQRYSVAARGGQVIEHRPGTHPQWEWEQIKNAGRI